MYICCINGINSLLNWSEKEQFINLYHVHVCLFVPGVEALREAGSHRADEHKGRLAAGLGAAHQLKKSMEKMMFALFMFS